MNTYLAGCRAKLRRAQEHLLEFDNARQLWIETDGYEIVHENHPESREYLVICKRAPVPPLKLGVLVGEIVNGLRTCLDNLIYALAVEETQQDPPPFERRLALPIFTDESEFDDKWAKRLAIFSTEARARIEWLQPFRERPLINPNRNRLWVLSELDNINKHRRLNVIGLQVSEIRLGANKPVSVTNFHAGPLEDDAVLVHYSTDGSPDVKVDAEFAFNIGFGEPAVLPNFPWVLPILQALGEIAEWTVDTFERDFF